MEGNITEYEPTLRLIEDCEDQNNKARQKCHNFSIESILSSASSALALAAKQEVSRSTHAENAFSLHPAMLGPDIFGLHQQFDNKNLPEDNLNTELVEQKLEHKKDVNEEDEEDVVVGSRSTSPSQLNTPKCFNLNGSSPKFPMFDLSKGKHQVKTFRTLSEVLHIHKLYLEK